MKTEMTTMEDFTRDEGWKPIKCMACGYERHDTLDEFKSVKVAILSCRRCGTTFGVPI